MSTLPFTNFTKGEIAPELQARIDTAQYGAAAKKVRNFIIQRYGGLAFRPGFRLVGEVDDATKNVRYIPFQYNIEQAYIMALEDERMRLLAGGGMIGEENLVITAITNAENASLTIPFHAYEVGDRIAFSGIVGMPQLNGRHATVVSVPDASTITIDIDTTSFGAFESATGTTRVAPPTPPPADPPLPPAPPPEPAPPEVVTGGGTGTSIGSEGSEYRYSYRRGSLDVDQV